MALIHPNSCECFHSGLEIFSVPPTQSAVEDGQFVEIHPLASLAPGAPIEFSLSGSGEEYLDLFNTYLHVRAKVTLPNGDNIPLDAEVAPVNYYMHSLFSQVDVSLNDTLITPSENTYPYRAYLEATLNYGTDAKQDHLSAACFESDTPPNVAATSGSDNNGLKIRRQIASGSQELDMIGRLHSDIFAQDRYLLNGIDLKIKLTPSKDSFNLIGHDPTIGFKSIITHATLVVRKAKLNPAISLAHEKALTKTNARYPIKRVLIKSFSVPKGMLSHTQDNLFMSQTPTRVVIGLLDSSGFNGSYNSNPFNFAHWDLSYLNVTVDGRATTGKPLTMDFAHSQYIRAYFGTKLALGLVGKDAGNGVSYSYFKRGYALYAFDLTPSLLDGDQFELAKSGPLSIELKFASVTSVPLQVIVYAELDSIIEVSKTRQVLLDYVS
jgi:hypothetical protein